MVEFKYFYFTNKVENNNSNHMLQFEEKSYDCSVLYSALKCKKKQFPHNTIVNVLMFWGGP